MKTLAQIDEIMGNAINQAKAVQKAETLEAAKERVTGIVTLVKKARVALREVAAAAKTDDAAKPDGG